MSSNDMNELLACRRFAVAGVSRSGKKFGNSIYKELKDHGYEVYIVHPEAKEIDGVTCVSSVNELAGKVDAVIVNVPPFKGEKLVKDTAAAGIKNIWLQQGANSPQLVTMAKNLNLNVVAGKCILMYIQPVRSVHSFHRFFAKLFGQL